jgi:hypothetical protein
MTRSEIELVFTINFLAFREIDESSLHNHSEFPTSDEILQFLATDTGNLDRQGIIARYKELTGPDHHKLFALPGERRLVEKVFTPLRHAIGSYMLKNYLGAIALCGSVCEMLAIFTHQLHLYRLGEAATTDEQQKLLYGSTFERLGQDRRVAVLKALNLIDDEVAKMFNLPKEIRNRYLHWFSRPTDKISQDAIVAWRTTRLRTH